ncbi:hypothetical protein NX722_25725 [Endozoicomonas gorgoniicola]|uniref:Magnesium transporter n=1 Tax=Endozoicomonas gorgoniicola TaxID=1234144 RepID=A0ABT3N2W7_9GAMM|nr:hypothetical protein [Endozoicomonas gorgoniicola]MCW7555966.1 hypothetical protein [Endozoicomonas gorgoniicola]
MIPLKILCEQCADALRLGPDGEQSIIDFWNRHSLVINRDQMLDRVMMSIECKPPPLLGRHERTQPNRLSESVRSYGACASYDVVFHDESTEFMRSDQVAEAASRTNLHEFFFRAHHVISQVYRCVYLRGSLVLKHNQNLIELLNGFSYEAVRNLTQPQINDLLGLLAQLEGMIGQMEAISRGASSLQEMHRLTLWGSSYGVFASLIISFVTMLIGGAYAYSVCRGVDKKSCLEPELGMIIGGAGIVFFVSLCIIFRKRCDPLFRVTRRREARGSIREV